MRFTVTWKIAAERRLGEIWLNSKAPKLVQHAADSIDQVLSDDAHLKGEVIDHPLRRLFIEPIAVIFEVSLPDRLVVVLSISVLSDS